MMSARIGDLRQYLRELPSSPDRKLLPDGKLLEDYVTHGNEDAFAALVQRYGPLVLGVCERVLHSAHDAEDAFQATFIVLARRAATLDGRGSLANWLYAGAYRTALKARAFVARRQALERQVVDMPAVQETDETLWSELRPVLDEELNRLPEKYRAPIVLCFLQGKSHQEAARELGWPSGSMSRRMHRARQLLRERLSRRGVALSAALMLLLLGSKAKASTVSNTLVSATVRSAADPGRSKTATAEGLSTTAAALAEEILKTTWANKSRKRLTRTGLTVIMLGVVALIAGVVTFEIFALSTNFSHGGSSTPPGATKSICK